MDEQNNNAQMRSKGESGAVAREQDLEPTYTDKQGNVHKKRILTGDRTTGKLHLGHYVGSLRSRVKLQKLYDTFILLADVQALTTHWENPKILKQSVMDCVLDYMAVGLDPFTGGDDDGTKAKIVVQSHVPAIADLTVLYGLVTPMSIVLDNPTTKAEAEQYGMGDETSETLDNFDDSPEVQAQASDILNLISKEHPEVSDSSIAQAINAINNLNRNNNISVREEYQYFNELIQYEKEIAEYNRRLESLNRAKSKAAAMSAIPMYGMFADLIAEGAITIKKAMREREPKLSEIRKNMIEASRMAALIEADAIESGYLPDKPTPPSKPDHMIRFENAIDTLTSGFKILQQSTLLRREVAAELKRTKRSAGLRQMTYGFLGYPVSQAADITFVNAHLVPVGEDQVPHIELTRNIVNRMNKQYGGRKRILTVPQALIGGNTLKALDGNAKMSKSLGNAIYLSDDDQTIWGQLKRAVTDPQRIKRDDPGRPEVCNVFNYHKLFNSETEQSIAGANVSVDGVSEMSCDEIADACRSAKIGCVECKKQLAAKLSAMLNPMRERRASWEKRPDDLIDIMKAGTKRGNEEGNATVDRVKAAMHVDYWD